jgi:hypothetical protein
LPSVRPAPRPGPCCLPSVRPAPRPGPCCLPSVRRRRCFSLRRLLTLAPRSSRLVLSLPRRADAALPRLPASSAAWCVAREGRGPSQSFSSLGRTAP